jgi:hypothetical protein
MLLGSWLRRARDGFRLARIHLLMLTILAMLHATLPMLRSTH